MIIRHRSHFVPTLYLSFFSGKEREREREREREEGARKTISLLNWKCQVLIVSKKMEEGKGKEKKVDGRRKAAPGQQPNSR